MKRGAVGAALACVLVFGASAAAAAPAGDGRSPTESAVFALVVGVNTAPEPEMAPLQYADDDAARYLDLFRALGARTYLLARPDENTRRLHVQAAAEAIAPRRQELARTVTALAHDVAQARATGVPTVLYVVYAGHGMVLDAIPYLTLEDGRLGGAELLEDVRRIGAGKSHVIVDACQAYLLAFQRGPGGERRPMSGFLSQAARADDVGLLLASSSSGESHEWAGFQAGVFSHEVRSGLYGAADADGDGRVSYDEIAAFVARANQAVANDRFRPQVLARAPRADGTLVDLRGTRGRDLRFEGPIAGGHHVLEDERGVRLLDFHGAEGAGIRLARPAVPGLLYLRRTSDGAERTIAPSDGPVEVGALPTAASRSSSRGAAHESFGKVFTLAFGDADVAAYRRDEGAVAARMEAQEREEVAAVERRRTRRRLGWGAAAGAVVAGAGATGFFLSAHALHDDAPPFETHGEAVARNQDIDARNRWGGALCAVSGALVGAAIYLLWPSRSP